MNFPQAGELHRRAGRQAVLQDVPVGCTVGLSWSAEKSGPEGCPFLQSAKSSLFSFGNTVLPPGPPIRVI